MTLVGTSGWIHHFQGGTTRPGALLHNEQILTYPFVVGELACGHLRTREEILGLLAALTEARIAADHEVLHLVESGHLYGRGLGWVHAHLLASAMLGRCGLWTLDRPLQAAATSLRVSVEASWKTVGPLRIQLPALAADRLMTAHPRRGGGTSLDFAAAARIGGRCRGAAKITTEMYHPTAPQKLNLLDRLRAAILSRRQRSPSTRESPVAPPPPDDHGPHPSFRPGLGCRPETGRPSPDAPNARSPGPTLPSRDSLQGRAANCRSSGAGGPRGKASVAGR